MKIKYQGYWAARKKLQLEVDSVGLWDLWNKTKHEKSVNENKTSAKQIAKDNHSKRMGYEVSIMEDIEDEFPFCYITVVPKNSHLGVNFIDREGRNYLKYLFKEVELGKKLFLREVWFYQFKEDKEKEDYRLHFMFEEDGNIALRKYDEIAKKTTDFEGKEPLNVDGLYEKYPDFGEYENVIKVERNIPFDLAE